MKIEQQVYLWMNTNLYKVFINQKLNNLFNHLNLNFGSIIIPDFNLDLKTEEPIITRENYHLVEETNVSNGLTREVVFLIKKLQIENYLLFYQVAVFLYKYSYIYNYDKQKNLIEYLEKVDFETFIVRLLSDFVFATLITRSYFETCFEDVKKLQSVIDQIEKDNKDDKLNKFNHKVYNPILLNDRLRSIITSFILATQESKMTEEEILNLTDEFILTNTISNKDATKPKVYIEVEDVSQDDKKLQISLMLLRVYEYLLLKIKNEELTKVETRLFHQIKFATENDFFEYYKQNRRFRLTVIKYYAVASLETKENKIEQRNEIKKDENISILKLLNPLYKIDDPNSPLCD